MNNLFRYKQFEGLSPSEKDHIVNLFKMTLLCITVTVTATGFLF
jgi:hypothetical protein